MIDESGEIAVYLEVGTRSPAAANKLRPRRKVKIRSIANYRPKRTYFIRLSSGPRCRNRG